MEGGGATLTIQAVQAAMFCHDMVCVGGRSKAAPLGAALVSREQEGINCDGTGNETTCDFERRVAKFAFLLDCYSK